MTLRFSKRETIILIVTGFFVFALILGSYFFYVSPMKEKIKMSEVQLKTEEQLLTSLQESQIVKDIPTVESIAELQRKIPVKQQLEQLMLDLEKAEVISGSIISNMSFAEGEIAAPAPPPAEEQQKNPEETETSEQNKQETENQTQTDLNIEAKPTPIPIPTGIKKLTGSLTVQSKTHFEFMKFIETLENSKRLVVVDSVAFSGGNEPTNVEAQQERLSYTLTFSAFYMPTLTDLQDQLSELKPPAPSNKTNPFSSFPDVLDEDEIE